MLNLIDAARKLGLTPAETRALRVAVKDEAVYSEPSPDGRGQRYVSLVDVRHWLAVHRAPKPADGSPGPESLRELFRF